MLSRRKYTVWGSLMCIITVILVMEHNYNHAIFGRDDTENDNGATFAVIPAMESNTAMNLNSSKPQTPRQHSTTESFRRMTMWNNSRVAHPDIVAAEGRSQHRKLPRVMLYIYAGGNSFDQNVKAQLDTFADNDTWYVTREMVPTPRRIVLSTETESGGRKMLSRKTMRFFHHLIHDVLNMTLKLSGEPEEIESTSFDFVMKADDDTYVNIPRIRELLARINPDIPFYAGSTHYGIHTGMNAGLTLGNVVPKGEYFRELSQRIMCHGGSGYILSRALLKLLRTRMHQCERLPPYTHMEDAKLAFCIFQFTGVQCTSLQDSVTGFDYLHNAKASKVTNTFLDEKIKSDQVGFASASTFHRVNSTGIYHIYESLQKYVNLPSERETLEKEHLDEILRQVHANTDAWFNDHSRRFVSTWNCSCHYHRRCSSLCQVNVNHTDSWFCLEPF